MKKAVGKFLENYSYKIILYSSLLSISLTDSVLALTIYSIVIHIMVLLFIIGLYKSNIEGLSNLSTKSYLFKGIEAIIIIIILTTLKHWYTLCISCFYMFLLFVHMFDAKKKLSQKKE
jgi:hypothetical protein